MAALVAFGGLLIRLNSESVFTDFSPQRLTSLIGEAIKALEKVGRGTRSADRCRKYLQRLHSVAIFITQSRQLPPFTSAVEHAEHSIHSSGNELVIDTLNQGNNLGEEGNLFQDVVSYSNGLFSPSAIDASQLMARDNISFLNEFMEIDLPQAAFDMSEAIL